jgi:hypothetical protein
LTEERFNFSLQLIYDKAKEWCKNAPTEKAKRLDEWHKQTIKKTFITELQKLYPTWQPPQ